MGLTQNRTGPLRGTRPRNPRALVLVTLHATRPTTVTELVDRTGIERPVLLELLRALSGAGDIRRAPDGGGYVRNE